MPDFQIISEPYPNGLKLEIDLEFLRPSTIIELANDLLHAVKGEAEDGHKKAKELVELHLAVVKYLSIGHADEFLDYIDS